MNLNNKITIIIVDDHPVVANGVKLVVKTDATLEILEYYQNAKGLLDGLTIHQPDVLILDIKLPDILGNEVISQIKALYPEIKILVLTYMDHIYYVKSMIHLGALGYVLKTCKNEILLDAIHTVARGEQYLEDSIKNNLVQHALLSKKDTKLDFLLTRREKEVLQLIATNISSQQIADKLFLSLKTIEFHRSNLLMKLNVKNAASLVKKAIQMNLLD